MGLPNLKINVLHTQIIRRGRKLAPFFTLKFNQAVSFQKLKFYAKLLLQMKLILILFRKTIIRFKSYFGFEVLLPPVRRLRNRRRTLQNQFPLN